MNFFTLVLALPILIGGEYRAQASPVRSTMSGVVREAISGKPLGDVRITVGDATAMTDSNGRFALSVAVGPSRLMLQREGYLEFQYPLFNVRSEELTAEIELRTDPLMPQMYAPNGYLPFLCVVDDSERLSVRHTCQADSFDPGQIRIFKHNPWSPYFGRVGDRGGVLVACVQRGADGLCIA